MSLTRLSCFKGYTQNIFELLDIIRKTQNGATEIDTDTISLEYKDYFKESADIYTAVQKSILELLKNIQEKLVNQYNKEDLESFKFILAGFADEIIIHYQNTINYKWSECLAERTAFGSSIAGEAIIENITKFLKIHSNVDIEMGKIFYYMLCMGFQGSLRTEPRKLVELKNNLLNCIRHDYGIKQSNEPQYLSFGPYEYTIRSNKKINIINYQKIYFMIFCIGIVLSFVVFLAICFAMMNFSA